MHGSHTQPPLFLGYRLTPSGNQCGEEAVEVSLDLCQQGQSTVVVNFFEWIPLMCWKVAPSGSYPKIQQNQTFVFYHVSLVTLTCHMTPASNANRHSHMPSSPPKSVVSRRGKQTDIVIYRLNRPRG